MEVQLSERKGWLNECMKLVETWHDFAVTGKRASHC